MTWSGAGSRPRRPRRSRTDASGSPRVERGGDFDTAQGYKCCRDRAPGKCKGVRADEDAC